MSPMTLLDGGLGLPAWMERPGGDGTPRVQNHEQRKQEMRIGTRTRRVLAASAIVAPLLVMPAASATPDHGDGHTVTICHVTNSATNPFVVITVDVAAFDGEGHNDHTQHLSKDGRTDALYIDGVCGGDPKPDPKPVPDPGPMP